MNPFDVVLRQATALASPPLCPGIRLHLGDFDAVWRARESASRPGAPPPFWSVAWPGGQALARYILDHPERVHGRAVLDLGAGSGIAAIAAAKAGARRVEAADLDADAALAIERNAKANDVELAITCRDVIGEPPRWDVVLAADLWYERLFAAKATGYLRALAAEGVQVLASDPGRAFFPQNLHRLETYSMPVALALEPGERVEAAVWEVRAFLHT